MELEQIVTFFNKTGKYIGEITGIYPDHYVVRTLAVLKHPMQGDLHHPKETDVAFFHERKALAYREQSNIPLKMVKPYDGDVPKYNDSLKQSVEKMINDLTAEETDFNAKSIESLRSIQREYELMYTITWNN
ncbi:kinase-associated lipoprotein B [Heyndrickxia vini]|uniref:Kinase-associated lipoprotein B n=1 Tax=Heyndrickxia vini TaxID=1476025 RepID=A0ABX7E478_9BACI|nr:kinase-associated lipoprotein B [Heyndrickxia vini]QQZ10518.1 kinase-associated lipoprotein B [Heyndrickxia vini]